jgi:hypothetical protein
MMRDRQRAAHELQQIGDAFSKSPWQQLGPPAEQLAAVRAWAFQMAPWREVGWR